MSNQFQNFKKTALLSALLMEFSAGVQAETIIVDNNACTLADAIVAANEDEATGGCIAGSGSDVIELPDNSIIELETVLPAIEYSVVLNCNSSTITRSSEVENFRIITNEAIGYLVTLNDCVITNGVSTSTSRNSGGGIGGNNAYYGELNINRSVITGNVGGGVFASGTSVNITDSIISNNLGHPNASLHASGLGLDGGFVTIINTTISGNKTYGSANGGGLSLLEGYFQDRTYLNVINSTITNNSSESGGAGIHIDATTNNKHETSVNLTHITVVNNTTQEDGGGLYINEGDISIENSIISGNSASIGNEIYTTGSNGVDLVDFNLLGLNGDAGIYGFTIDQNSTNAVIQEVNLSDVIDTSLNNNGGLTLTHALTPNSPAIDFIPAASCNVLTDQTGKNRPLDGDDDGAADCDVGAFENEADLIFQNGFEIEDF